jgi:hypothetical protein
MPPAQVEAFCDANKATDAQLAAMTKKVRAGWKILAPGGTEVCRYCRPVWEDGKKENEFGNLVVRQPLPGKLRQFNLSDRMPFAQGCKSDDAFSVNIVRRTNDTCFHDRRMLEQSALDLLGRDV